MNRNAMIEQLDGVAGFLRGNALDNDAIGEATRQGMVEHAEWIEEVIAQLKRCDLTYYREEREGLPADWSYGRFDDEPAREVPLMERRVTLADVERAHAALVSDSTAPEAAFALGQAFGALVKLVQEGR